MRENVVFFVQMFPASAGMNRAGYRVQIGAYVYEIEAESAALLLRTHDIDVEIGESGIVSSDPLLSNAVGGIKLFVNKSDEEKALDILSEDNRIRNDELGKYCYNCESTDVVKLDKKITWKTIVICVVTLGIGLPLGLKGYKEYRCNKCGKEW